MKLLLDTHIWLWWQMRPERLSKSVMVALLSAEHDIYVSTVSSWEMAVKISIAKLQLPKALDEMVPESLSIDRFHNLALHHHHAFELARLPMHHRDPFDRMLIAQARQESMTLVTADKQFQRYDVQLLFSHT